jgi:hypothetical protein
VGGRRELVHLVTGCSAFGGAGRDDGLVVVAEVGLTKRVFVVTGLHLRSDGGLTDFGAGFFSGAGRDDGLMVVAEVGLTKRVFVMTGLHLRSDGGLTDLGAGLGARQGPGCQGARSVPWRTGGPTGRQLDGTADDCKIAAPCTLTTEGMIKRDLKGGCVVRWVFETREGVDRGLFFISPKNPSRVVA